MGTQPEQVLEDNLVKQLQGLGYSYVTIKDEQALLANLKTQLEKHNQVSLTEKEFERILNHLNKGNVFDRAKVLRDKMQLTKDDGTSVYLEFLQQEHWCKNLFQVTQQVTIDGTYKNRYDVTLLVNGLPLVQIELKRRGLELKEAFNQVNRYHRHSFGASHGLFQYVQLFVISNGVNTKYYANNKKQNFKQTFYWADTNNKLITQLEAFTKAFLEPCHLAKMVTKYIVLSETHKILMVLRPYQYYATEAIIERVKNSDKNGYIWHTTGSGKTLTSFKASQLLMQLPKVHKVVFVVDRKDLDYQTTKEFNSFSAGSIDGTDDTRALVGQLSGDTKLIVTTIQKLNNAIGSARFSGKLEHLREERVVFIFDECHRSQFGETHNRIKSFFAKAQLFGFTGTPIFAENVIKNDLGKRTTRDLFDECLHKYLITDAIKDENVLKFSVEYVGRYREKAGSNTEIDIEVEDIDTKELLEAPQRLEKIVDYIIEHHPRKTHGKEFTGMFCVSSVDVLIRYYELFQKRKAEGKHNLKIATIFSYTANEEDKGATGDYMLEDEEIAVAAEPTIAYTANSHTREKLDAFIVDYNTLFNTKFSTKDSQSFYNYYNDISKRVKNKEIDLLLVVNMYLTGFDSPPLSTLYVDKNLKYHGLIQAYSRTNRLYTEQKSQGNIVVFRNLKQATDDAIALFSNKDAKDIILVEPYEDYVTKFNIAFGELLKIAPTVGSVDSLPSEEEELTFVKAFRELMRIKNVLTTFADFSFANLAMSEQSFEDYKSKYLDLYDKVKTDTAKEKESILNDVDFELELIHRDEINVSYILKLLAKLNSAKPEDKEKQKKQIIDILTGETTLRSKRELIRKFIEENLPHIEDADDVPEAFESFWQREQIAAFEKMSKEEQLDPVKLQAVLGNYLFTERTPLREEVLDMLPAKPKLLERKPIAERITAKMLTFVETFINGIGARV
ncbi:type I restriction endonuclease subunit R [Pontibacter sp. BT731]|uniref:type I restriction endonuclease subunit R n=1 Tax=Pontibacter coccineus TaxID=3063328 RepID=UPI0026E1F6B6|nr:type I restriction endonuclease subunit R [Pontibacter sp. BT731]MDO6392076.1 type I restriction endonuclease subunit R [Pontibacter sp. BT731]